LYECGKTKIFIRNPQTLFALEDLRLQKLNDIIKIIQKRWREVRGRAFAKRVRQTVPEIFYGQKERRRDSVYRPYTGDYIKAKNSRFHKEIKKKYNEKRVVFADKVSEIDKGKPKARVLILTEGAFYFIGGFLKKITSRVAIQDIVSVELSTYADGVIVLNCGAGKPATVLETPKKTEVVGALHEIVMETGKESGEKQGPHFTVRFSDSLEFNEKRGNRKITFAKDESVGSKVAFKTHGNSTVVNVANGLEKTAGPQPRQREKKEERIRAINRSAGKTTQKVIAQVKALYDYPARNARELSFKAGDVINVTNKSTSGQWQGEFHGKTGTFPASLVQEV